MTDQHPPKRTTETLVPRLLAAAIDHAATLAGINAAEDEMRFLPVDTLATDETFCWRLYDIVAGDDYWVETGDGDDGEVWARTISDADIEAAAKWRLG